MEKKNGAARREQGGWDMDDGGRIKSSFITFKNTICLSDGFSEMELVGAGY